MSIGSQEKKKLKLLRLVNIPEDGMVCFLSSRLFQKLFTITVLQSASDLEITLKGSSLPGFYGTLILKCASRHYLKQCKQVVKKNAGLRFVRFFFTIVPVAACVVQLVEHLSVYQEVAGYSPGQGTYLDCRLNPE